MTQATILRAFCSACQHNWLPWGEQKLTVPFETKVACPNCDLLQSYSWYDEETAKKKKQKELGLLNIGDDKAVKDLDSKVTILQKELALEVGKRELFEARLKLVEDWKKEKAKMINEIEESYEEEKKFREENK